MYNKDRHSNFHLSHEYVHSQGHKYSNKVFILTVFVIEYWGVRDTLNMQVIWCTFSGIENQCTLYYTRGALALQKLVIKKWLQAVMIKYDKKEFNSINLKSVHALLAFM